LCSVRGKNIAKAVKHIISLTAWQYAQDYSCSWDERLSFSWDDGIEGRWVGVWGLGWVGGCVGRWGDRVTVGGGEGAEKLSGRKLGLQSHALSFNPPPLYTSPYWFIMVASDRQRDRDKKTEERQYTTNTGDLMPLTLIKLKYEYELRRLIPTTIIISYSLTCLMGYL